LGAGFHVYIVLNISGQCSLTLSGGVIILGEKSRMN